MLRAESNAHLLARALAGEPFRLEELDDGVPSGGTEKAPGIAGLSGIDQQLVLIACSSSAK